MFEAETAATPYCDRICTPLQYIGELGFQTKFAGTSNCAGGEDGSRRVRTSP